MASALVFNIQRFCTHDGPGIRTTVFLKGCPLDCFWCHNPEAKSFAHELFYTPQICIGCGYCVVNCPEGAHKMVDNVHIFTRSACHACLSCTVGCNSRALESVAQEMSAAEVLTEVEKDRAFYEESGGGLTISGGEPTSRIAFVLELASQAQACGISTAIETCGFGQIKNFVSLIPFVNLFLWDIKDTDEERHLANTGAPLEPILRNLKEIDKAGGKTILRCLLLEGINLGEAHLARIAAIFSELSNCRGIELLEYHPLGGSKLERLGLPEQPPLRLEASSDAMSAAVTYLGGLVGYDRVLVP